jgi:hypothetical protein
MPRDCFLVARHGGIWVVTSRSRPGPRNGLKIIATAGTLAAGLIMPALASGGPAAAAGGLGPPNTFVATGPLGVAPLHPQGHDPPGRGGRACHHRARPPQPCRRDVTFTVTG